MYICCSYLIFVRTKHDASIQGYNWLYFVCAIQCRECQPSISEETRLQELGGISTCFGLVQGWKHSGESKLCLVHTITMNMLKEHNLTQAASGHFLDSESGLRCKCRHDLILQILGTEDSQARTTLPIGSRLSSYKVPWISAIIVQTQNGSRLASEPEPHASAPRRLSQSLQCKALRINRQVRTTGCSALQAQNITFDVYVVGRCAVRGSHSLPSCICPKVAGAAWSRNAPADIDTFISGRLAVPPRFPRGRPRERPRGCSGGWRWGSGGLSLPSPPAKAPPARARPCAQRRTHWAAGSAAAEQCAQGAMARTRGAAHHLLLLLFFCSSAAAGCVGPGGSGPGGCAGQRGSAAPGWQPVRKAAERRCLPRLASPGCARQRLGSERASLQLSPPSATEVLCNVYRTLWGGRCYFLGIVFHSSSLYPSARLDFFQTHVPGGGSLEHQAWSKRDCWSSSATGQPSTGHGTGRCDQR